MPVGKAGHPATPVKVAAVEPVTPGDALLSGAFSEAETFRRPAAAPRRSAAAKQAPCKTRVIMKRPAMKRPAADVGIEIAKKWKASMALKDAKKAKAATAAKGNKLETADKATADAGGQEDMEEEDSVKAEEEDDVDDIPNGQADPDIEDEEEEEEEKEEDEDEDEDPSPVQKKPAMKQPNKAPAPRKTQKTDAEKPNPKDRVKARKFMKLYSQWKDGDESAMPEWIARAYEDAKKDKSGRMQDRVRDIVNNFMSRDGKGNLKTDEDNPQLAITRTRINRTEFNLHSGGYLFDTCLHRIAARLGRGPDCQIASTGLPDCQIAPAGAPDCQIARLPACELFLCLPPPPTPKTFIFFQISKFPQNISK